MDDQFQTTFRQMIGGSEERFFHDHWRKKTLFNPSSVPSLRGSYDFDRFRDDYRSLNFHHATLLISVDGRGNRKMVRAVEQNSIDDALSKGMCVVLQALLLPSTLCGIPQQWRRFVTLHGELCEYLLPDFPFLMKPGGPVAAVDIFCSRSESTSGGHYDSGDVFYFVLDGEKEWTVELSPDYDMGIRLAVENAKYDLSPRREHLKIRVRPGDCLYVPPYTYHRVSSLGRSLAVSVGLPAFTEYTLLRSSLPNIQKELCLHQPLPTCPRTQGKLFGAAEEERKAMRRRTLETIEHILEA